MYCIFWQVYSIAAKPKVTLLQRTLLVQRGGVRSNPPNPPPLLRTGLIDIKQSYTKLRKHIISHFWDHFLFHFNPDLPCTLYTRSSVPVPLVILLPKPFLNFYHLLSVMHYSFLSDCTTGYCVNPQHHYSPQFKQSI